jgi:hypothetical protein
MICKFVSVLKKVICCEFDNKLTPTKLDVWGKRNKQPNNKRDRDDDAIIQSNKQRKEKNTDKFVYTVRLKQPTLRKRAVLPSTMIKE